MSLVKAREARDLAKSTFKSGVDPATSKKESLLVAQRTLMAVTMEWVLVKTRVNPRTRKADWSASYHLKVHGRLENDVFPFIGHKPVLEIQLSDIIGVLTRIEHRNAMDNAFRVRDYLKQIFNFARGQGYVQDNPAALAWDGRTRPEKKNYAAVTDPVEFGHILRLIDDCRADINVVTALKVLPLLMVRPENLRNMRWGQLDFKRRFWTIPVSEMKNGREHLVPLSTQAIEILQDYKPWSEYHGDKSSDLVFPSRKNHRTPISDNTINKALRNLGICTKTKQTAHGFRASATTMLLQVLNYPGSYTEMQLAHWSSKSYGGAYDRALYLEQRCKMMQHLADFYDQLREEKYEPKKFSFDYKAR